MKLKSVCKVYYQVFYLVLTINSWFLDQIFILDKYSWDFRCQPSTMWPCVGRSFSTCRLVLCEEIPILTRFTILRKVKSSTNWQRSSSRIQLALLFVPYDWPRGSRSRHGPRFWSFSMLFHFHWHGPTVICKNCDQTWTHTIKEGFNKKREESVTTFHLGLPPTYCDPS